MKAEERRIQKKGDIESVACPLIKNMAADGIESEGIFKSEVAGFARQKK